MGALDGTYAGPLVRDADGYADFVVDVYIPITISVHTTDPESAASMAIDHVHQPLSDGTSVYERVQNLVNTDVDSPFVMSDSEVKTEVGW